MTEQSNKLMDFEEWTKWVVSVLMQDIDALKRDHRKLMEGVVAVQQEQVATLKLIGVLSDHTVGSFKKVTEILGDMSEINVDLLDIDKELFDRIKGEALELHVRCRSMEESLGLWEPGDDEKPEPHLRLVKNPPEPEPEPDKGGNPDGSEGGG